MATQRPPPRKAFLAAWLFFAALFGFYVPESLYGLVTSYEGSIRGNTPQISPYFEGGMGAIGYIRKQSEISNETPSDNARHVPALPDRPSDNVHRNSE
jgi:hypothetical protein